MIAERRRLIERTLGRSVRSLVEIEDGYDFEVAIVDGDWIFRFPRRVAVIEALEVEVALLPRLALALPVLVPWFEHVGRDPHFVAYRRIDGQPFDAARAEGVAAFLSALHAFDATDLPVPRPQWRDKYAAQCAEFDLRVCPLLEPGERNAAVAMFDDGLELLDAFEPVLLHADIGPDHLLCRDAELVGVIDWADARIGDAALDFAWLLNGPPPPFGDSLVAAYRGPADAALTERARFYHRLGPWYEVHYGLVSGRDDSVRRGLAGVRRRLGHRTGRS